MSKQFRPTKSNDVFVGRRKQIDKVLHLLDKNKKKWLVHITGDGGIGKTRFLQVLRDRIAEHKPVGAWQCTQIIDFYKPANQTAFGLLNEIARQVGLEFFDHFVEQRKVYDNVLRSEPDQAQQQEAFERVANAFFEDLQELLKTGRRIVLFFDTCEESRPVSRWITWKLLARLSNILEEMATLVRESNDASFAQQPLLLAIFAGRTPIPFQKDLKNAILNIHLAPFNRNEMADFFEKVEWYPHKINKKQLTELFVRCAGRPLYMAMSYDWLANEMGTVDDLLSTDDSFRKKLVDWILRFRDQQSNVILSSALAWRRMEAGLLAKLLRISESEAIRLFEDLSKYSFVKYRRPDPEHNFAGSFQLHDVMRHFVNEHTWPGEGNWTRKAMLHDVLGWYEQRIGDASVITGQERPKFDEQRSLLTEYLYYKLLHDVSTGAKYGETLFKKASYFIDLSLCDLYNAEINRFSAELPEERIDQLRFQQALVAFRKDDYAYARGLWNSLIRRPNCSAKLYATSHLMLLELEAYAGNYSEALAHALVAEKRYKLLLEQPEPEPGFHDILKKEISQLYNNWGYLFRAKSDWDDALRLYKEALNGFSNLKHVARTLNNIGFVYFKKNDIDQALAYVRKALQVREKIGIPYELGLGYNTLGMLTERLNKYGEARKMYYKAKNYFEVSYSERGLALVNINLGRLARANDEFDKALQYLKNAVRVLEEKNDRTYLIIALKEKGCVYRQRGGAKDRKKAEEYFNRSLGLSREIGDRKSEAENLEDLSILYYDWSKAVKPRNKKAANEYLDKTLRTTERVTDIAQKENLPVLLAKVTQTNGEIEFEKQKYGEAFDNMYKACELISGKDSNISISTIEFHRHLAEIADRMQERLQALPNPQDTVTYARRLLERLEAEPENIRNNLNIVHTKINATLEMSRMIPASA